MKYWELSFKIEPYSKDMADVLTAVAAEAGLESFVETETGVDGYVRTDAFDADILNEGLSLFPTMNVEVSYTKKEIEDRNWNEEWERNGFQPVLVTGRVLIHNPYQKDLPHADYHLLIDPHQAFGTGNHQTTSMIIERLVDMDITGLNVLDAGCGTGILGIFCAMKGAENVFAYDIDPWSVQNTVDNMQLNGIDRLQVVEGDASVLAEKSGFDLVLANINRNILLADMPSFVRTMKKDALIILSGFYTEDIPLLQEKADSLGLVYIDSTTKDNWATLMFRY